MWDLFKSELLRFRAWALALAVANLLMLGLLTRMFDLAQQPVLVYRVIGAGYALTGLLLGLYQMGGYRRPNTWLNLLHRPLASGRVATALLGAGMLLLMVAIALPLLIIAGWQETMTARVVDLRHWLIAPSSWLIASCAYFAGAYAMLGGRRYAVSGLVLVGLLIAIDASGIAAIAVQALILLTLAVLVAIAFKPDLSAPPKKPLAVLLTAVPIQLGVYYLLVMLCFGVELIWILQGSHPNNSTPMSGGFVEANKAQGGKLMLAGLAASAAPEAALWREQVKLSEVHGLDREFRTLPARGDATNPKPMEFDDRVRQTRWVFSHDRMRLEGYSLADGRSTGELGVGSEGAAFPAPALPIGSLGSMSDGDSVVLAGNAVFQYRSQPRRVDKRMQLPDGEQFAMSPTGIGESIAALSDQALYMFDGRDVAQTEGVLGPRLRIRLPGSIGNLTRIDLIELVDGYLMSYTFTSTAHNGRVDPWQQLQRVHDDGRVEEVARRALLPDYPVWHRFELFWLSPAMQALHHGVTRLFVVDSPLEAIAPPPVPRSIRWLAAALCLLSLTGAWWWSRRLAITPASRIGCTIGCGIVGIPALISLWLIHPHREPAQ